MEIKEITTSKEPYKNLLLLADEEEDMMMRYLERGTLYVMSKPGERAMAVCVVTDEGNKLLEIKNIAVAPEFQRHGYGRAMVEFIKNRYRGQFHTLQVGTGDSPLTIPFYESCGFQKSHVIKDFFTTHYRHPIYEGGKQLVDMIYLRMDL